MARTKAMIGEYRDYLGATEKAMMERILESIGQEVSRARSMWGTRFDQRNTLNDWAAYANIYISKATDMSASLTEQETNLRKAAGLLISALITLRTTGFAPRHYEGQTRPKSLPEIE